MSNRIEYIDVCKFIGLALVCFCHIPMPCGDFHIWVYSFHMPMFFILSGMFYLPERFSVKRNVVQLLVPFLIFNVIAIVISASINFIANRTFQIANINLTQIFTGNYPIGPSWFLLSLFCIRIICHYVYKIGKELGLVIVTFILLVLFMCFETHGIWNALNIGSTVLGLPFYVIGYLLSDDIRNCFVKIGGWKGDILLLLVCILAVFNGQVGIHEHSYGKSIISFLFFGVVGTLALLRLSTYIHVPHKILDTFTRDGALFFICMHTLIFEYLLLIWKKITGDFSENTVMEKIAVTILTFVVSYPVIRIMLNYTPILLGKQKK